MAPSVPVAFGVFVAYVAAFHGLTVASGVTFDDRFANAGNAFRGAVVPLAVATLLVVGFALWARWGFVLKDPERLPMTRAMLVAVVVYAVAIVVQFAVVDWSRVSELVLPLIAAAVLVGIAEETLFRGVILRSLRTNARPEAWAVLITTVWFGAFHMIGVISGMDVVSSLIQSFLAAASGVVYYLFRRLCGTLVLAVAAHGLWDLSLFLPASTGSLRQADRIALILVVITSIVALAVLLRHDRTIAVTRTGVQSLDTASADAG